MAMRLSVLGGVSIDFSKMEPCTMKKEPVKKYVTIGQKVRFDPFVHVLGFGVDEMRYEVTGTVVEVFYEHKWFLVEYGDPKQRISYKFCDIGERVKVIG